MNLSKHFTLEELTKTSYRTKDNNCPTPEATENLQRICQDWLEPLRYDYNRRYVLEAEESYETSAWVEPVIINQGYRSPQVSEAMRKNGLAPAKNSNHLKGCAVDIRCMGVEQALRYMTILLDIGDTTGRVFDELILERRRSIYWIHFAVRPEENRRKICWLLN